MLPIPGHRRRLHTMRPGQALGADPDQCRPASGMLTSCGIEYRIKCWEAIVQARDIMSPNVITVSPNTPVRRIAELMVEHRISGTPVVGDAG